MEEERTGLQDDLLSVATPGGLGAIGVENYHYPKDMKCAMYFLLTGWAF